MIFSWGPERTAKVALGDETRRGKTESGQRFYPAAREYRRLRIPIEMIHAYEEGSIGREVECFLG